VRGASETSTQRRGKTVSYADNEFSLPKQRDQNFREVVGVKKVETGGGGRGKGEGRGKGGKARKEGMAILVENADAQFPTFHYQPGKEP